MTFFTKPRSGLWIAAALLAPVLVMSGELWITHHFLLEWAGWDYLGIALSIAIGLLCLWCQPITVAARLWWALAYVPLGIALLVVYALFFVCYVFGDCL